MSDTRASQVYCNQGSLTLTEIGRRSAILIGTLAFAISAVIGILHDGDMVLVMIRSVGAALIFGAGGLLIGNMTEGYVFNAARRELARQAMEREIRAEMKAEQQAGEDEEENEDTGETE